MQGEISGTNYGAKSPRDIPFFAELAITREDPSAG